MAYQLIFEGRMVAGEVRVVVQDRLAKLLKTDRERIQELFENPPTVIKKDLERGDARRYQAAFEKTGALCEIVPMEDEALELAPAPPLISPEADLYEPPPSDSRPGPEPRSDPTRDESSRLALLAPIAVMLMIGGYWAWRSSPVSQGPGDVAPNDPIQIAIDSPQDFTFKDYTVHPKARFQIEARVLGTERYHFDSGADLIPWDFALGWGPMSNDDVIEKLTIRQGARFYTWSTREFPIPRGEIEVHSANMHLIPATSSIARKMGRARKGHIVTMNGYLVHASGENGWSWKSSMTRDDTGPGACELVWVDSLEIR